MSKVENPIINMLLWRVRKLSAEEVLQVLAILASIEGKVFTLTDVIELLPRRIVESRHLRRCVGTLLQNLVELGYLSKPSERKWSKNYQSFSHFLNHFILELSSLEKGLKPRIEKEKIVSVLEKPHRASRQ
ncbi:MAG: hypothetical protein ABDH32_01875 [Candidatus Caldarchaeales archaeon]